MTILQNINHGVSAINTKQIFYINIETGCFAIKLLHFCIRNCDFLKYCYSSSKILDSSHPWMYTPGNLLNGKWFDHVVCGHGKETIVLCGWCKCQCSQSLSKVSAVSSVFCFLWGGTAAMSFCLSSLEKPAKGEESHTYWTKETFERICNNQMTLWNIWSFAHSNICGFWSSNNNPCVIYEP